MKRRLLKAAAVVAVPTVTWLVACGTGDESTFVDGNNDSGAGDSTSPSLTFDDGSAGQFNESDASISLEASVGLVTIDPPSIKVDVDTSLPSPAVQFQAKINGQPATAVWSLDRGELGSISSSGVFTPAKGVGGTATVFASANGVLAKASVTVSIHTNQNGDLSAGNLGDAGAGGYGGVGGEGPGGNVDLGTLAVLNGTPADDPGLSFIYPYDKTVFPRGILPPLLQWKVGSKGDYDAVSIHIKETAYEYRGYFAKPAGAPVFQRHPIPSDVWKALTYSNNGEDVEVTIVLAKAGVAYGPLTEMWKIAKGSLKGTVYYNSYGTKLALNYDGAKLPGTSATGKFGGATLSIKPGATAPALVAGGNGDASQCRVCHSVASNGSRLITQRNLGALRQFSGYDLKGPTEVPFSPTGSPTNYSWPAIYPDGTMFVNDASSMDGSNASTASSLYEFPAAAGTPTKLTATGLGTLQAATPMFSPDGKLLAYNYFGNVGGGGGDKKSLAASTFDVATKTFGSPTVLYTPASGTAAWPSFLPTNNAIIFHLETRANGRDFVGTRADADTGIKADVGARAELWWVDVATKTAAPLKNLNGTGYLPTNAIGHLDDATLNYEPTVNPVVSGGYAWVVFTSRRLYGNVATMHPFHSDPRYFDLTTDPTTKKLWVAAIDLNAPPGSDPSHPAFYLPAQELLAGNARGYWVVDPCKSDSSSCETGDECCGGYCRANGDGGALVCSSTVPTCAQEFENCTTSANCCNGLQCVNGRCAAQGPTQTN